MTVRHWMFRLALVSCAGMGLALLGRDISADDASPPTAKQIEFFEKKIRPVLVAQCYKCHSAEAGKPKGGLLVDTRDGLLKGGETGPAVVPGSPADSLLIEAIRHDGLEMPPERKLPDAVIADFVEWVRTGAADPRTGAANVAKKTIDIEEGRKFWAFQPPKAVAPPTTKDAKWAKDDVDRFVLAALEARGIKPVSDADRRVLVRRLSFDLIGLPPTPEEVDAFVNDESPKALERFVDRLLASPHFGERWGRHWLDVARYAESNGNADNVVFGEAWRYRDYVIASFNADKPFDRFIREQIAGDLLSAESPAQRDEHLIATGFLALGSKPRAQNNPDFQMDVVAEQIEVTTSGFMALTVGCARCHDHKFDPIPTAEYYSMAGIFTSTQTLYGTGGRRGPNAGLHTLAGSGVSAKAREEHAAQVASLEKERSEVAERLDKLGAVQRPSRDAKKPAKNNKNPETVEFRAPRNASADDEKQIEKLAAKFNELAAQVARLKDNVPSEGQAMGARDAAKPADCQICLRGESQKRGDTVSRGFVTVATIGDAPKIDKSQSGRLELADWIAAPQNPLTARVLANRVWRHLFGRGIVTSVDNFGVLGEKPSHPELLDHLALRFVDGGWSVKKLIRSIVLTRSYGLSSDHDAKNYEKDPDNVLVWRHAPRRLDAESLRDAVLYVAGKLNAEPWKGSAVGKLAGQDLRRMDVSSAGDSVAQYRSIYLPIIRNGLPEMLDLFDVADPSLVIGQRDVTTVPAQSLFLMNSPFAIQQSRLFAARLLANDTKDDGERVHYAIRLALGRDATADERTRGAELLTEAREEYKAKPDAESLAWAAFCQGLLATAEFRYVD